MEQKLFTKDFTLVVIGQIISLFGNAALRFALPLYLLNMTGSSALYGTVTACAFLPAILLSPVGGIIADRVNKRNVMVILDFFTSAVILVFMLLMNEVDLIVLLTVTLMLLYGIAGAYQPSVQASIPALTDTGHIMAANSIINTISSFSALIGPVIGGILYSAYGLKPVLLVCVACFFVSARFRPEHSVYPPGQAGNWKNTFGNMCDQPVSGCDDYGGAAISDYGGTSA